MAELAKQVKQAGEDSLSVQVTGRELPALDEHLRHMSVRGVHISMGKFQSGFLKKHIIFPGCILLPESKYVRVEHFDPGK